MSELDYVLENLYIFVIVKYTVFYKVVSLVTLLLLFIIIGISILLSQWYEINDIFYY